MSPVTTVNSQESRNVPFIPMGKVKAKKLGEARKLDKKSKVIRGHLGH